MLPVNTLQTEHGTTEYVEDGPRGSDTSSLQSLPNEILSTIFAILPTANLIQLALVCVRFAAISERLLYTDVNIVDVLALHPGVIRTNTHLGGMSRLGPPSADLDESTGDSVGPWRTILYCQSLKSRPYLLSNVRKLNIRWHGSIAAGSPPSSPPSSRRSSLQAAGGGGGGAIIRETLSLLNQLLSSLSSLESLELFLGPANTHLYRSTLMSFALPSPSPSSAPTPLNAIELVLSSPVTFTCPKTLVHLALTTDGVHSYASRIPVLQRFLLQGVNIRSLRLGDFAGEVDFNLARIYSPSSVPSQSSTTSPTLYDLAVIDTPALSNLALFRGTSRAAASLLPGRPVTHLSLIGTDEELTDDVLSRIALTSAPKLADDNGYQTPQPMDIDFSPIYIVAEGSLPTLHTLDLSAISVRPALLRVLSKHLGDQIEVLKLRLALRHTLHYAMSGIRLLSGLSTALSAFPRLVDLDLSPTAPSSSNFFSGPNNATQEQGLCEEWGKCCPLLKRVIFPSRTEWLSVDGSAGEWECVIKES